MTKRLIVALGMAACLAVAGTIYAQEVSAPGAKRMEVGLTPAGGTFFNAGSDGGAKFGNYAIGANMTYNINRWVGVEGEVGGGVGIQQTIDLGQLSFADTTSPNTLAYNVNLAVYPRGNDRAFVPYVTFGGGGMTLFARDELNPLGLTGNETFGSENIGAGLKWWASNDWGVRGDYRFIVVNGRDSVNPFFGLNTTRYGNRISGSLMYTFGAY